MTPDQFLKLAQVLPEALLLLTKDGEILAANRSAKSLFGSKSKKLAGECLIELVTEQSEKVIDYLRMCSQSRQMILGTLTIHPRQGEKTTYRTQGAVIQPSSSENPAIILLRLEKRDSSKFVILNQKIHELSKEIQQRQRAQRELSQSNEALKQTLSQLRNALDIVQEEKMTGLSQLAAGIAHEINNPIGFIYSNIEHINQYCHDLIDIIHTYQQEYPEPNTSVQEKIEELELEFLEEDLEKLLFSLKTGSKRVAKVVKSLRTFSRLDEADFKDVDIHEGLDAALMLIQNHLRDGDANSGIKVIKDYNPLPLVYCSPGALNQVFINLLSNSIDALEELKKKHDKCIWIQTEQLSQSKIAIHIRDNGTGIPANIQDQIFNPFFTTKPVGQGTGLGLSVTYRIVESHGGTIDVKSEPGWGTQFSIQLPIAHGINLDVTPHIQPLL
ncbi:MAG: ATP-binding protein [Cyanobacteria bacterium J06592_8]